MKIFLPPTPLLALLCSAYVFHRCCKAGNCMSISKETKNGDMFSIWNYDGKIAYKDMQFPALHQRRNTYAVHRRASKAVRGRKIFISDL